MTISHPQLYNIERIMKGFHCPWFIAGGWSIDLEIGEVTRNHEDIDICIFREHSEEVLDYFSDWQIQVAIPKEGRLEPVRSIEDIFFPRYGLHLHKGRQFIEILLTDKKDGQIVFRRDPEIKMDVWNFIRVDPLGRKYAAPEMQLLYKAKEGRAKDEHDFSVALPQMSGKQKEWLLDALMKHHPDSPWINRLKTKP